MSKKDGWLSYFEHKETGERKVRKNVIGKNPCIEGMKWLHKSPTGEFTIVSPGRKIKRKASGDFVKPMAPPPPPPRKKSTAK